MVVVVRKQGGRNEDFQDSEGSSVRRHLGLVGGVCRRWPVADGGCRRSHCGSGRHRRLLQLSNTDSCTFPKKSTPRHGGQW